MNLPDDDAVLLRAYYRAAADTSVSSAQLGSALEAIGTTSQRSTRRSWLPGRAGTAAAPAATRPRRRPWRAGGTRPLLLAAMLVMAGVAAALVAGGPSPSPTPDLLALARDREVLQVRLPYAVDWKRVPPASEPSILEGHTSEAQLAQLLLRELTGRVDGLPIAITPDAAEVLHDGTWDLVLPTTWEVADPVRYAISQPLLHAPVYLEGSGEERTFAELDGLRVCAVEGSAGAAWLAGDPALRSSTPIAPVPEALVVTLQPTFDGCREGLGTRWDLQVTAGMVPFPGGPSRWVVGPNSESWRAGFEGDPVLTVPVSLLAAIDGPDPTSMLALLDAAITRLHADGTLASLSERLFLRDMSVPPPTDGRDPTRR